MAWDTSSSKPELFVPGLNTVSIAIIHAELCMFLVKVLECVFKVYGVEVFKKSLSYSECS